MTRAPDRRIGLITALWLALPAVLASSGAGAAETAALPDAALPDTAITGPADTAGPRTPYDAMVTGVEDKALLAKLEAASRLLSFKDSPPATLAALRRRAEDDAGRLRRVLAAEARFAAVVTPRVEPGAGAEPARATVAVEPGPAYTLADFVVAYSDADSGQLPQGFAAAGLTPGMPALADPILAGIEAVALRLHEQGRPFARVVGHKAVLDHGARTVAVVATIDAGPPAAFGATTFSGLVEVREDYVRGFLPWAEGAPYDSRLVARLRRDLLDTALFATVEITPSAGPDTAGRLAMTVKVTEAPPRSIGGGVTYSSSLGAGVMGRWEHRNILGADENLLTELALSQVAGKASAAFRKPHWRRRGQDLTLGAITVHEELDAYDRDSLGVSAGIERPWRDTWTLGIGAAFEVQQITDDRGQAHAELISLPLFARRDTTTSRLDPRRGVRYGLTVIPYTGLVDEAPATFFATRLDGALFVPLGGGERGEDYVLALRGAVGSLLGAGHGGVPADKRTYVGGGGSLRGYGHQMAGDVAAHDNDPLGGKSLIDLGIELRAKITETIEIVPFLEAGRAFPGTMPDFGQGLFYGAGLGLRYHTPIGPARLDVAVPLDRRAGIDDPFQIYISLGQAF